MLSLLLPLALAEPPTPAPAAVEQRPAVHGRMANHYLIATEARAAVLRGDVDSAQDAGKRLSKLPVEGLPDSWQPALDALAQSGRDLAVASSLDESAKAFSGLLAACADCHQTLDGGPGIVAEAAPPPAWTDASHMPLHLWASEWIWLGFLTNDDTAVLRGAEVLAGGPVVHPSPTHDPAITALEGQVHTIAREMATAPDLGARRELYAPLISRCGSCHRMLEAEGATP